MSNVVSSFFAWHFYQVPAFLLQVWKNFIEFSINFFSTPLLLKTLFAPWRRYSWSMPRGFDIQLFFENIISNFFSRFLGAICRIVLIVIGIVFQLFVVVAGAIVFLVWLLLPLLLLGFLLFSLGII